MTIADELNRAIYGGSPFEGFDIESYPLDLQGWFDDTKIFDDAIDEIKPELIIEVGSWKGLSSHHLIQRALRHKDASIICIDTWLGSSEHWSSPEWRKMLNLRNGRPRLHEQFMANVIHAGLQNRVVPLPQPSRLASVLLKKMKITAPLVFIDGAHDEASVREDINAYWPLVSPGGVMLGDDYHEHWSGLVKSVERFRAECAGEIERTENIGNRWLARKRDTRNYLKKLAGWR